MIVDENVLKGLIGDILKMEKDFLNEKQTTESKKIKDIKRIIENEVRCNDN